ncbi:MAG: OmpA family protein [Saprospiraceae bacterium]
MSGEVKDKKNDDPIPFAQVKVVNSCTGKEMEITADRLGEFTFPMDCNCDYEITASKGDYRYDYEVIYSYDLECDKQNTSVLLYLEKEEIPPTPEPTFEVGKVIRLDKLYYDYDKFFIRSDAAVELDRVVSYMKKYPSLEIELGSHTDARGSDEYNRELSQNRANAAVEYIISRGISRNRITAAGYGETQLVNRCKNGVNCPDYEHQQNRRTEIKITRFNEKGVRVED